MTRPTVKIPRELPAICFPNDWQLEPRQFGKALVRLPDNRRCFIEYDGSIQCNAATLDQCWRDIEDAAV